MSDLLSRKTLEHLLSLPNVIGIGYGLKETGGALTEKEAVVVLVEEKVPTARLAKAEIVPKFIEGKISDVLEVGKITPYKALPHEEGVPDIKTSMMGIVQHLMKAFKFCSLRKSRWRPAPGGVSIGHYKITAGTLGTVVYDRGTGEPLILSNNHVLANETNGKDSRARIGDPILQPGPLDGGTVEKDKIAKLYRFVPLKDRGKNLVDAAVAKPLISLFTIPSILGIGRVKGTVPPKIGMSVQKSGRTTCVTEAKIRLIRMVVKVEYDEDRELMFKNQILVENFDEPGDSGSLVLDKENRAVGLLFAGSERYTFVNPIEPVLDLLNVRF